MLQSFIYCVSSICRLTAAAGQELDTSPHPVTGRSSHAAVALDQELLVLGGDNRSVVLNEFCIGDAAYGVQASQLWPDRLLHGR